MWLARPEKVPRRHLIEAMAAETGYDRTTTTLAGRFQGSVYLRLARRAVNELGADRALLFIDQEDWYRAYLEVVGLGEAEAPEFVRLAHDRGQDVFLDARPGRVIAEVEEGPVPELAVNVRLAWPEEPGAVEEFSYEDRLSVPDVRITVERELTFRLLDLGGWIFFDEVDGTKVKPLSGALAVLFGVIGLADVREVRLAVADDDTTLVRARARKLLVGVGATVTIAPDGRARKGIPEGRPDLAALEEKLLAEPEIDYVPYAPVLFQWPSW